MLGIKSFTQFNMLHLELTTTVWIFLFCFVFNCHSTSYILTLQCLLWFGGGQKQFINVVVQECGESL